MLNSLPPGTPRYRSPLLYAIILHALLFAFLFWHFVSPALQQSQLQPDVDIIKAVAVNPQQLKTQLAQAKEQELQAAEQLRKQQEEIKQAQAAALHKKQMQEQQKAKAAALEKQQEAAREKAALAKQQAAQALKLQQQQEAELKLQQAAAAAKKAKQEQQKQQTLEKEIAKEKAAQQEQAEEAIAAKALAEQKQEKAKQADKEKKAAQKLKLAQQQDLDAQIAQEKQAADAARTKDQQSEIEKYKALIENAIQQYWVVPGDANPNISCDLLIHVGPGGTVLSVQVVRSSGDGGLDNSAKTAVFKASPLPVPSDDDLFEQFRELKLTVKPEIVG